MFICARKLCSSLPVYVFMMGMNGMKRGSYLTLDSVCYGDAVQGHVSMLWYGVPLNVFSLNSIHYMTYPISGNF